MKVDAVTECSQFLPAFVFQARRMNGPTVTGILAGELESDAVIATRNQNRGHGDLPSYCLCEPIP